MTALKLRETVRNGGIFIPLSRELDNQEVEIEVTVRTLHPAPEKSLAEVAEEFFSRVTVRSTEDFDPYDQ